jgi:SAM-dependent methyltransferase
MNGHLDRFGEGYFEKGEGSGYVNYSWQPDLIWPRVQAIIQAAAIQPQNRILDFGCAKGFYVRCLRREGFQAFGIDVSSYALSHAPEDVRPFLSLRSEQGLSSFGDREFDLTIAKDVLEHLAVNELQETVEGLCRISKKLIVTVPICGANRRYINANDELDVTHTIRFTLQEWMDLLGAAICNSALCVNLKAEKARGTLCTIIDVTASDFSRGH